MVMQLQLVSSLIFQNKTGAREKNERKSLWCFVINDKYKFCDKSMMFCSDGIKVISTGLLWWVKKYLLANCIPGGFRKFGVKMCAVWWSIYALILKKYIGLILIPYSFNSVQLRHCVMHWSQLIVMHVGMFIHT